MIIKFLGATRTVTGSSYYLESPKFKLMVDCGMFQGNKKLQERNTITYYPNPKNIPYLLLTHAHIDHIGLMPLLVKKGFCGKIIATEGTCELCEIMLKDSAHIQEMDAEWHNRKNKRSGKNHVEPLYTVSDAESSLRYLYPIRYDQMINLLPGVNVRFRDAGHIFGSAMIELWYEEEGDQFKIVFSGDIGNWDQPIINDPTYIEEADFLIMESTYGNRLHKTIEDTKKELAQIVNSASKQNAKVIIPAFALERTQDIIYTLSNLYWRGEIPLMPLYIDSPLAIATTEIFKRHQEYYDIESKDILKEGRDPLEYPNMILTNTTEESKMINQKKEAAIIISASGMCDAGRILHHLKHNLWRPETHIVFTGYQATGTLGRELVDGKKKVKILGEEIQVNAKIHTLGGFSAHADQNGLLNWLSKFKNSSMKVFIVHGEEEIALGFAELIKKRFSFNVVVPQWKEIFELKVWQPLPQNNEDAALIDIIRSLEESLKELKVEIINGRIEDKNKTYIFKSIEKWNSEIKGIL